MSDLSSSFEAYRSSVVDLRNQKESFRAELRLRLGQLVTCVGVPSEVLRNQNDYPSVPSWRPYSWYGFFDVELPVRDRSDEPLTLSPARLDYVGGNEIVVAEGFLGEDGGFQRVREIDLGEVVAFRIPLSNIISIETLSVRAPR